jgi:hypothetical protein
MKRTLAILFCIATVALAGIISGGLVMLQIDTPANPASGSNKLYFKSDNKLYSLTSTGTETEIGAAGGGAAACDPTDTTALCLREDFSSGITTIGSPTGQANLRTIAINTGYLEYKQGPASHLSYLLLSSGAVSGDGAWVGYAGSGSSGNLRPINWYDLYNGTWEVVWVAKLESTANIRVRLGFDGLGAAAGSVSSASMWIRYDTNASYDDDAKASGAGAFVAQICGYDDANCSGDATGLTATLAGTVDTNWHRFRIYRTAGKINFQVDTQTAKTACVSGGGCDMTLPANPGYGLSTYGSSVAAIVATDTTAIKSLSLDYLGVKFTGLSR